jgi:hypothetical protein
VRKMRLVPGGLKPGVAGDGVFCASQMQFFSVPYRAVQSPRGSDSDHSREAALILINFFVGKGLSFPHRFI